LIVPTLLMGENKSKAKGCTTVSLGPLRDHPTVGSDHVPHQDIYHYHNILMRVMSIVTEKMADSVPFSFLLISPYTTPFCMNFDRHIDP
jgi:hypothetical protein